MSTVTGSSGAVLVWDAKEKSDPSIIQVVIDFYLHLDSICSTWVWSDKPFFVRGWSIPAVLKKTFEALG